MGDIDPMRVSAGERWALDPQARRLMRGDEVAVVGERAFDLLLVLARSPGQVVATELLLSKVWPGRVVEDNNLHVHMAALRRLLGADAIRTVRGQGYQLTRPVLLQAPAEAPAGEAAPQPPRAEPAAGNLPHRALGLIGRSAELQALLALLDEHRSITLAGPAGVGKTSLAVTAAQQLQSRLAGPAVWLVELAGVAGGAPVAEAVARTLGIALPGLQRAQDELVDVLRARRLLLLLDNCEHRAREVSRLVGALTQDTDGIRVLVTSQVPLQHAGERLFRLQPLEVPAPRASAQQLRAAGSVALFCARLGERAFAGTQPADDEASLRDVAAICQGLDGLPLALELAAARVPLLGLAGVRQRLGEQLKLLSGGRRDAPARQQTLRAAIQWSHALLDEPERQALRRLAVFAGGFTLALAQQVISDPVNPAGPADDWAVLDLLQGLLDKSLLVHHGGGPATEQAHAPRLRLLESTRSFAQEQLRESGEQALMTQRLAQAMLALFVRGDGPRALDPSVDDAEARAPDLDNLRAALDALSAAPAQSLALTELTGASAWIWSRLGLRAEGMRRCRLALQRVDAHTPAALEAQLQLGWATLVHRRGADGDTAAASRAAELYQGLGDRLGRFRALSVLASMLALEGEQPACEAALEDLADSFDPTWGLLQWAAYHWTLGACLAQFDRWDEVQAIGRTATARMAVSGHASWMAVGWSGWAQVKAALGDYETAVKHAETGVALIRQHHVRGRLAMAVGDLAAFLVEVGRLDEALPLAREAVALRATDGTLGQQLDQLARLACVRGRFREAAMALGRADAHHVRRRGRRDRYLQEPMRLANAAIAQALPADEATALRLRGAAMGDDEVARLTVID